MSTITLAEHVVNNILVTNDPDLDHIDEEIFNALHGKSYRQLEKMLSNRDTIEDISFVPDPGEPTIRKNICPDTVDRLMPFIPFFHGVQTFFGPPRFVGEVDMRTMNRSQYNGYIRFEYDEANPTTYDHNTAMDIYNKRPTGTSTPSNPVQSSNNNSPTTTNASSNSYQGASKSAQLVTAFKKTRRNIESYDVLKEDVDWDDWNRTFKSMADLDECEVVLDHFYSPGPDEQDVFDLKQKHMYAVLLKKLQTIKGKELVKQYDGTHDAQKIYHLLVVYYTDSQHAEFVAEELLQKIVTATMPCPLEKPRKVYIHEFKELMRKHNLLSVASGVINDKTQLKYIKRYAEQDSQMRAAKLVIESQRLLTGVSMNPARALAVLEHHAGEADNQDKAQILTLRSQRLSDRTRRAYMSDMMVDPDDFLTEEQHVAKHWYAFQVARASRDSPDPAEVESHMHAIEAFRTQGRPSHPGRPQNPPQDEGERVRIDGEAWNQLSRDGQRMFRSFSAADTRVISEFFSKLNLSDKATNAGAVQPFNRHAHLTELDDDDEEDDDPIPATRGSASRIANNDSRMVNTHRISTNFTSPFDAESNEADHDMIYEAHNTTMDLEATNPLRFLSVAKKQADDKNSAAPPTPNLVERADPTSSDGDTDSFNDGDGPFRLVIPKSKKKQRKKKTKNSTARQTSQEPLGAAHSSRDVNAYEFLMNDCESDSEVSDSHVRWGAPTSRGGSRQVSLAQHSTKFNSNLTDDTTYSSDDTGQTMRTDRSYRAKENGEQHRRDRSYGTVQVE